jgi:hypothetical protein
MKNETKVASTIADGCLCGAIRYEAIRPRFVPAIAIAASASAPSAIFLARLSCSDKKTFTF